MEMNDVVEYYFSTVDEQHPEGNMKEVAEHFNITRAKAQKILFTMEAIDSPLHQDIMRLKAQGYDIEDIASVLGVSKATVSINIPYEKTMYNQEEKSPGAVDVENYRKREKVFLNGQKRKLTPLERVHLDYMQQVEHATEGFNNFLEPIELKEDLIHLNPQFTEEESELFHTTPDIVVLHIELMLLTDEEEETLKKYGEVKYGKTISRDILVHDDMPLHNLHYLIQQIFGFQNYHLHNFQMPEEQLQKLTNGKAENWLHLMGTIFKNPLRDDYADFWDDDYEGGSPKKYMRSKYTGPYLRQSYDETFQRCREDADRIAEHIPEDVREFRVSMDLDPYDLLERIPIGQILDIYDENGYESFEEYMEEELECINEVKDMEYYEINSQPYVYPVAKEIIYTYDYGDYWQFSITPVRDVQSLVDAGRVKLPELRESIKRLCEIQRPVLLAADGFNLVEDAGGVDGYCAFLRNINGEVCDNYAYDNPIESRIWAESLGWKDKVPTKAIV